MTLFRMFGMGEKKILEKACSVKGTVTAVRISRIYGRRSICCSVMSDSFRPPELQPIRLLCPWNSQGKNTGVG